MRVLDEIAASWRVPWAAGTVLVGIPILVVWHAIHGRLTVADLTGMPAVWLAWAALLRWHFVAKGRLRR